MIVLGVDPGTARLGFGLIQKSGAALSVIEYGCVETQKTEASHRRLHLLYQALEGLIKKYRPTVMSIETLFFSNNAKTAFAVGQARGVAMLLAAQKEVSVAEYTPLQVKSALVGYGNAQKNQVQYMVQKILKLASLPEPDDAADALAIAICHAHSYQLQIADCRLQIKKNEKIYKGPHSDFVNSQIAALKRVKPNKHSGFAKRLAGVK